MLFLCQGTNYFKILVEKATVYAIFTGGKVELHIYNQKLTITQEYSTTQNYSPQLYFSKIVNHNKRHNNYYSKIKHYKYYWMHP